MSNSKYNRRPNEAKGWKKELGEFMSQGREDLSIGSKVNRSPHTSLTLRSAPIDPALLFGSVV